MRIIDRWGSRLIKDKGFLTVLFSQAEPFYERHDLVSHWKDIVLTSISSHFMTSIFRQATSTIYNRKDITLKGQDVRRGSYYSMWHDERGDHAASHSRKSKKSLAGASKAAGPNQKNRWYLLTAYCTYPFLSFFFIIFCRNGVRMVLIKLWNFLNANIMTDHISLGSYRNFW